MAPAAILAANCSHFANLRLYPPGLKIIRSFILTPAHLRDEPLVIMWKGYGAPPHNVNAYRS
jgi:hypothetical protein